MLKKLTLVYSGMMLALIFVSPVRCQESPGDPGGLGLTLISESEMAPAISYPQNVPLRPIDPAVVQAVRGACCDRISHLQIRTTNGSLREGKVHWLTDQQSFEFRPSKSKIAETVYYRDVISATILPPTFGEAALEGVELAGAVVLMVAMSPLMFLMGVSCGFTCS